MLVTQRFTPLEDKQTSLGELRQAGRARGDSEKKALYYLLKWTQDCAMRFEKRKALMEGPDPALVGFCEEKGVPVTVRQVRKFLRRKKTAAHQQAA